MNEKKNNDEVPEEDCYISSGEITRLEGDYGIISYNLIFYYNVVEPDVRLNKGEIVTYMAYKHPITEAIRIVKIKSPEFESWDEGGDTQIIKQVGTKYFKTNQRNVIGKIVDRLPNTIVVDVNNSQLLVKLDNIEMSYVPWEGDFVSLSCITQHDTEMFDGSGEILDVKRVDPLRMMTAEKCFVVKIFNEGIALSNNAYLPINLFSKSLELNVGDSIVADLVECDWKTYEWRAINIKLNDLADSNNGKHSIAAINENENNSREEPTNNNNGVKSHAVIVSPDQTCFFSSTYEKKTIEFIVKNNCAKSLTIQNIGKNIHRTAAANIIEPENPSIAIVLEPHGEFKIKFEVMPMEYGEKSEHFRINFGKFYIRRQIFVYTCEGVDAMEKAMKLWKDDGVINNAYSGTHNNMFKMNQIFHRLEARNVNTNVQRKIRGEPTVNRPRFVALRFPSYLVPDRLRYDYLSVHLTSDIETVLRTHCRYLMQELNCHNYVVRFRNLLQLEEIENFINFRQYDCNFAHFGREGEYLSLAIENLYERRPSLAIGDTLLACDPYATDESKIQHYEGVIHKVLYDRILLKFDNKFQAAYNCENYKLVFHYSRFSFRKYNHSVGVAAQKLGDNFLFPSRLIMRSELQMDVSLDDDNNLCLADGNVKCPWFNERLNFVQKTTICNILRGEATLTPYIIFGPPGTGKTMTLVETILQLSKQLPYSRLIVATPSNSAANLIATRLLNSHQLKPGEFVRLVSQQLIEKELIPDHLMKYSATIDIALECSSSNKMIVTDSGLKLMCSAKTLGAHRIIIGTCSTIGNLLQLNFPKDHFTHVLIDEAGQCLEPEIMAAISLVSIRRGQVIIVGDPYQLSPVVINRYAVDYGLSLSFLERLMQTGLYQRDMLRYPETNGYNPRLITKLIYNYRSIPSVLHVYNSLFYETDLMPIITEKSEECSELIKLTLNEKLLPPSGKRSKYHGAFFRGIIGQNVQLTDSPSWYNPHEAKAIYQFLLYLYKFEVSPHSVGIITPYTRQVKHLRNLFTSTGVPMPKIGTVEEFQGQEFGIILISTVRSSKEFLAKDLKHSLGFVKSSKRMNVAVSRAKYLLVVFGNPMLLCQDVCWRSYIRYCLENDSYMGCKLQKSLFEDSDDSFKDNKFIISSDNHNDYDTDSDSDSDDSDAKTNSV